MKSVIYRNCLILMFILGLVFTGCSNGKEKGKADTPQTLNDTEQVVFEKINDYRISKGLKPLNIEQRLVEQARKHSKDMAEAKVPFGHEGFEERIRESGLNYRAAAENVGYNQGYSDPAGVAVEGWIKSEGHRKNIEGNFDITGIGTTTNASGRIYFTQIFMLQNKTPNSSTDFFRDHFWGK